MTLRSLQLKDAPVMLKWMHDFEVVKYLNADFDSKTLEDCQHFIHESVGDKDNVHLAIADEDDKYVGTVSLKYIDQRDKHAEFAIVIVKDAFGQGYAKMAMQKILEIGFNVKTLNHIYWCVSKYNLRALRFYNKNGYVQCKNVPDSILERYSKELQETLVWYCAISNVSTDNK